MSALMFERRTKNCPIDGRHAPLVRARCYEARQSVQRLAGRHSVVSGSCDQCSLIVGSGRLPQSPFHAQAREALCGAMGGNRIQAAIRRGAERCIPRTGDRSGDRRKQHKEIQIVPHA